MYRFLSLGSDKTALEEVSNLFINLFTVSFMLNLYTHDLVEVHSSNLSPAVSSFFVTYAKFCEICDCSNKFSTKGWSLKVIH